MVDFQSRDTRRDDEADESAESDESEETEKKAGRDESEEGYAVVTVEAGGTRESDHAGNAVVDAIEAEGETIVTRDTIQPSYDGIQNAVATLVEREDVAVVVTIGGTGVEPDDMTVDAIEVLLEKALPGFGELFRLLSHDQEGTAVIGTRTTAGIVEGTPVFALPGSTNGALLGTEKIILQEAGPLRDAARPDR